MGTIVFRSDVFDSAGLVRNRCKHVNLGAN